tara:strand:- start:23542 stop:23847 length:306 start_codon:yes stop_codon:yes gene_type:complete
MNWKFWKVNFGKKKYQWNVFLVNTNFKYKGKIYEMGIKYRYCPVNKELQYHYPNNLRWKKTDSSKKLLKISEIKSMVDIIEKIYNEKNLYEIREKNLKKLL